VDTHRDRSVLDVPRWETSIVHPDASLDLVAAFGRDAEADHRNWSRRRHEIPMAEVAGGERALRGLLAGIARMLGSLRARASRTYGSSRRMLLPA
jgi:hypothetical protein